MDIHIKPIVTPRDVNYENHPDWVVFRTGKFSKPDLILTDLEIRELIDIVCEYHKIKIDL